MSLLLAPAIPTHPVHQSAVAVADALIEDIFEVLLISEEAKALNVALIDSQPEIAWESRPMLLQFLLQLKTALKLPHSTFSLAVSIVDRYSAKRIIYSRHHRLVASAALWIAAKTQGSKHHVPSVNDLIYLCGDAFTARMICEMELHILSSLEWDTNAATTYDFAQMIMSRLYPEIPMVGCCNEITSQHFGIALFLSEIGLFTREGLVYSPSILAASAIELSCTIISAIQEIQNMSDTPCFEIPGAQAVCKQFLLESMITMMSNNSLQLGEFYGNDVVALVSGWIQNMQEPNTNQYPEELYHAQGSPYPGYKIYQPTCLTPVDSDSDFAFNTVNGQEQAYIDARAHQKGYHTQPGAYTPQSFADRHGHMALNSNESFPMMPASLRNVAPLTPEDMVDFASGF